MHEDPRMLNRTPRLLALLLLLAAGALPALAALPVGQTAPDFTLPTVTGEELSLSQFRGQVVILHFWKGD
ncbi:MAG: hypothetical protein C4524_14740 [Candidatus Zixiibacteriota bacterium]|nr:MAG: hypothetical protein C4524_14740 [candidate division Zixibacteria bacterium]